MIGVVRDISDGERASARARALGAEVSQGLARLPGGTALLDLAARFGITPPLQTEAPVWQRETLEGFTQALSVEDAGGQRALHTLCEALAPGLVTLRDVRTASGGDVAYPDPDQEVGTPGTYLVGGIVRVDPAARMQPFLARGLANSIGQYERTLREPVTYKSYQSIRELLVTGAWTLELDSDLPDGPELERAQEARDWIWRKLRAIDGGWDRLIEELATCIPFGFSIFEPVWDTSEAGRPFPRKLAFREPSTVERWLMDVQQRDLLAVRFLSGGDASYTWALPADGPRITDQRVMLCTLAGRGNNFEGIPPTRAADLLITYKQLALQIHAAASERFGCPLLVQRSDPAMHMGVEDNAQDSGSLFEVLEYLQAMDTPAINLPPGVLIEYIGAAGQMPDMLPIIEYLDRSIASVFSTQAQTLGSGHGSYALAQVQDDDLLRSIPYYARTIAQPINALVRRILTKSTWGIAPEHCPRLSWAPRVEHDSTRWFADLKTFVEINPMLPEPIRATALEKLGLPPDAFDAGEEEERVGEQEGEA